MAQVDLIIRRDGDTHVLRSGADELERGTPEALWKRAEAELRTHGGACRHFEIVNGVDHVVEHLIEHVQEAPSAQA